MYNKIYNSIVTTNDAINNMLLFFNEYSEYCIEHYIT